jgi:hypothetical protein
MGREWVGRFLDLNGRDNEMYFLFERYNNHWQP